MTYATLQDVKAYVGDTAVSDTRIEMDLEFVNSEIEDYGEGYFTQATGKLKTIACRWVQMLINKSAGTVSEGSDGDSESFANTAIPVEVKDALDRYYKKVTEGSGIVGSM
jgi:hypothetical protein